MTADDFASMDAFETTEDFILRLTGFSFFMFYFALGRQAIQSLVPSQSVSRGHGLCLAVWTTN